MIYLACPERFWGKIEKTDGCWIWKASLDGKGYGQVNIGGRIKRAHRVSFELIRGEIPSGLSVLHSCDNRKCVRPDHMFLGTALDNVRDMDAKGRRVSRPHIGEDHAMAILSENQAREVLHRALAGENQHEIAAEFGISNVTVSAIKTRRLWKTL